MSNITVKSTVTTFEKAQKYSKFINGVSFRYDYESFDGGTQHCDVPRRLKVKQ